MIIMYVQWRSKGGWGRQNQAYTLKFGKGKSILRGRNFRKGLQKNSGVRDKNLGGRQI